MACSARCTAFDDGLRWSRSCTSICKHACGAPPADAMITELDVSDCAARPIEACNTEAVTLQEQLDRKLEQAVLALEPTLAAIRNGALVVSFEDGCPRHFYTAAPPFEGGTLTASVHEALREVRWSCAIDLSCAIVRGPDTLQ